MLDFDSITFYNCGNGDSGAGHCWDGVAESAVVGIPDPKWGEKVAAAVKLAPGADVSAEAIKMARKEKRRDWKCPKEILFVSEIPRNTMEKVLKEVVKGMFDVSP